MNAIQAVQVMMDKGILKINSKGEIWRLAVLTRAGDKKPITPKRAECRMKNGYLGVKVCLQNKQFLALAHRVVWTILRGQIPPLMDINHIDGNKQNNDPSNLEIVTRSQNLKHAVNTGLRAYTCTAASLKPQAIKLREDGLSYSQIAKKTGVSLTTAFRAVNE